MIPHIVISARLRKQTKIWSQKHKVYKYTHAQTHNHTKSTHIFLKTFKIIQIMMSLNGPLTFIESTESNEQPALPSQKVDCSCCPFSNCIFLIEMHQDKLKNLLHNALVSAMNCLNTSAFNQTNHQKL